MIAWGRSSASSTSVGLTLCRATWPTLCKSQSKPLTPPSTGLVYTISVYTKRLHIQCAEKGLPIRRALDLLIALKLAVHIGLDDIRGDEFCAMSIIAEERDLLEQEKLP